MKSNQLVLLLVVIGVAVAGFFLLNKQKTPVRAAAPPVAATDPTGAYLGFASSHLDRFLPARA